MAEAAVKKVASNGGFNVTLEKSKILKSISKLQSIVEKRNTIPILSNVKIDATAEGITLTVTDMDLVASEEIEANVGVIGSLTVPALTLYDIVRKLPEGSEVNLEAEASSGRLFVTSGSSKFTLSFLPSDDFPVMSEGELTHTFTMPSKDFVKLIDKSKFAMSNEETRYYLNGVYFHNLGDKLKAVATDGHRLASVETTLPEGAKDMPGVIIPRKAVNEIGKLLENQEEVKISVSDSKIKFEAGKIILLSKVVDGTFPDYQRVIPENNKKILTVSTSLFKEAVDRVSTISADKTRAIKVKIEKDSVTLLTQGLEGASGKEDIAADYKDEAVEIGFNSRYVLEMMGHIGADHTNFALDNPNAPALVTDPSDSNTVYIIMPMRV